MVLGLVLFGTRGFGACPCKAEPCLGNGSNYFQEFIDNSCPFPPNLLKVEWNGIFGSQTAWLPSVSQGSWRTNLLGVSWEASRVTDGPATGHWTVRWKIGGASDFQSASPGSTSNCQAAVSWSDPHGSWSVMPCDWVKPSCQLLASSNYVSTVEFIGLVDPCGSPILGQRGTSGPQPFEYGQWTPISNRTDGGSLFVEVNCPDGVGDHVTVTLVGEPPAICSATDPDRSGRFVALYSSPVVLTNVGTSIAGMILTNNMCGTVGCDFDWWGRGGYAVIRLQPTTDR